LDTGTNEAAQLDVPPFPGSVFFSYTCNTNTGSALKLLVVGGADVTARKVSQNACCAQWDKKVSDRRMPVRRTPRCPPPHTRSAPLSARPVLHSTRSSTCAAAVRDERTCEVAGDAAQNARAIS